MHLLSFYFLLFFIQNHCNFVPSSSPPPPPNYKPITFKEPSSDMVVWDRITKPILSYSIHSHLLHALNVCELGNATMYIIVVYFDPRTHACAFVGMVKNCTIKILTILMHTSSLTSGCWSLCKGKIFKQKW